MIQSSLDVAEKLGTVEYISTGTVNAFVRSRRFKAKWSERSGMGKIAVALQNPDVFVYRALGKVRSILSFPKFSI